MAEGSSEQTRPQTEVEALTAVAYELRALRAAYRQANRPEPADFLDSMARLSGLSPKTQRERRWLEEARRSNRLATVAIWVAGIAAVGSVLTGIATLVTVL